MRHTLPWSIRLCNAACRFFGGLELTESVRKGFLRPDLKTLCTILVGIILSLPQVAEAKVDRAKTPAPAKAEAGSALKPSQAASAAKAAPVVKREQALSKAQISEGTPRHLPKSLTASATSSIYDRKTVSTPNPDFAVRVFGPKAAGVRYDSRMMQAMQIAEARARKHSTKRCWRYVKTALVEANVVNSYPKTANAKEAGAELTKAHGFKRLSISDPFKAPVGSVLVYGGKGPGHVEIRTRDGFVSDFESPTPSKRPLLGVYVKPG